MGFLTLSGIFDIAYGVLDIVNGVLDTGDATLHTKNEVLDTKGFLKLESRFDPIETVLTHKDTIERFS